MVSVSVSVFVFRRNVATNPPAFAIHRVCARVFFLWLVVQNARQSATFTKFHHTCCGISTDADGAAWHAVVPIYAIFAISVLIYATSVPICEICVIFVTFVPICEIYVLCVFLS